MALGAPLIFVLLAASGCSNDAAKATECKQLARVIAEEDQKLVGPDPTDAATMHALADKLDGAAKAVGAVSLTIPDLVTQRDAIQAAWTKSAAAVRLSVVASEKIDRTLADQAEAESEAAGRAYTDAVASVNRFCPAN